MLSATTSAVRTPSAKSLAATLPNAATMTVSPSHGVTIGLMIGIEPITDCETKAPATREASEVRRLCREAGVIVGVGGRVGYVVRFQTPLVISDAELDRAIDTLDGPAERDITG